MGAQPRKVTLSGPSRLVGVKATRKVIKKGCRLTYSRVAEIQDRIKVLMWSIARGQASWVDKEEVMDLQRERSRLMYEHGLEVSKMKVRGESMDKYLTSAQPDDVNDKFKRDYPLGEYVHVDLPNKYDPSKVHMSSGRHFACAVSRASLDHRTWYIHKDDYKEFMDILDSGVADRWKNRDSDRGVT